ncbi:hypothetical protein M1M38_gp089 [Halorubrum tailed virus 27]|uniref:Uncharacterized protein n=1 Tax=Halorubrum tailed virus 27 TaxID=2878008 RepID=A0AAE8XYU5_9CAUD|nr:hypothetical protein M1M38_gp089 [Halorubrum tailed virus 27]UBF22782.1 hypothetical protein HRTV-27_gp89 [Halorubrum tailed virus 27]
MSKCDFCGHLALNGKRVARNYEEGGYKEYRGPAGPTSDLACRNCAKATLNDDEDAWDEMDRRILAQTK